MSWDKPETCPESTCTVFSNMGRLPVPKGGSYVCWGRLAKEKIQVFNGYKHVNTHCFCIISPEKGHVRFYINLSDAVFYISGFNDLLKADVLHNLTKGV